MPDHLHIDTACGATAEALLAALVDLGVPLAALHQALAAVPATAALVLAPMPDPESAPRLTGPTGERFFSADLRAQLDTAPLAPALQQRAAVALDRWLTTPAAPASLTAREFGYLLAIAAAFEALGPATVSASPLPLPQGGSGATHERLLAQLRDALVRVVELPPAAVTPLGVALVRGFAEVVTAPPVWELTGYGTGRDADGIARVRVLAGRRTGDDFGERLMLLETNLDDLQPELLATLIPLCLTAGAVDAWLTPALMKKGRPAQVLSALCPREAWRPVEQLLFRESSTLGVRRQEVARTALCRQWRQVDTAWGPVRVKLGLSAGVVVNCAPEFEDCRQRATAAGVPVKQVYAAALASLATAVPLGALLPAAAD